MEKNNVAPEVVAAITAAVQEMLSSSVVALRIKKSDVWSLAAKMDR